jgi:putative endopeptidase
MKLRISLAVAVIAACITLPQVAAQTSSSSKIGFDVSLIDKDLDPCNDFYEYACAGWKKNNPVPADLPVYGRFTELYERNLQISREILEGAAPGKAGRSANEQKIGDFYASCMDEDAINKAGISPLNPHFALINGLKSKAGLTELLAQLKRRGIPSFFVFGSQQDDKDSNSVIAVFSQSGLGLPNRDYYLGDEQNFKDLREKYVAYMTKMFTLAGNTEAEAAQQAKTVMEIETTLAQDSFGPADIRDSLKTYNPMTVHQLQKLTSAVDFKRYLRAVGAMGVKKLNVTAPSYWKGFQKVIDTRSLDDIKTYLRWRALNASAILLAKPFDDTRFDFFGKALNGQQEQRPRWKRCINSVDGSLGEALGMVYVEKTFGADGKARMMKMIDHLQQSLEEDIDQLDWMTPATKKRAKEKLSAFGRKIGSPDHPRDFAKVTITPKGFFDNVSSANIYENNRDIAKIGKPVDRAEWTMNPQEVNAQYISRLNEINFPAGILQPPYFDRTMDDAINYGAIGMIIGHEFTHGFDNDGSQYDAKGNLENWWTDEDRKEFDSRTACINEQYSKYEPLPGLHIDGKLTLGENVADNAGLRIAYMALQKALAEKPQGDIDGYTPQQRFFLGFAQSWCSNSTDEFTRLITKSDEHSFDKFRVIGPLSNLEEFREAFGCKAGSRMAPEKTCRAW